MDRLTHTAHIGNNSLQLLHSMQPNNTRHQVYDNCIMSILGCTRVQLNVYSYSIISTLVRQTKSGLVNTNMQKYYKKTQKYKQTKPYELLIEQRFNVPFDTL